MRADAKRNYELLVSAARDVFAAEGSDASMEAIARKAGVGVGTLYRHFPKRIDVVEAVYRGDVDELVATAEQAVAELEPLAAVE
ncbi:MAG TPA: helix-turn-helix domain-containing protein, partial [Acidimicrobiales bacterium]|nr:helix-turn-helix domain-containing protein [Acidimicrobiales bacterium]